MKKKVSFIYKLIDPRMWFYDFTKWTGALFTVLLLRTRRIFITGKKKKGLLNGSYIISSNHMSYIDPIIISTVFPTRRISFVATKELFASEFWNIFFHALGIIKIDKENTSLSTFKEVEDRLNKGHLVGVFPEGQVTQTNEMNTFKSGIIMMAIMSQVDILPVYLAKRKLFTQRQVAIVGEKLVLKDYIESPFPTMDEINKLGEILAQKEKELENKYKEIYKEK